MIGTNGVILYGRLKPIPGYDALDDDDDEYSSIQTILTKEIFRVVEL